MSILHVELPKWMRGDGAVMRHHKTSGHQGPAPSGDTAQAHVSIGAQMARPGDTVELCVGDKVRCGDAVLQFEAWVDGVPRIQLYSESQARHLDREFLEHEREKQQPARACHV